MVGPQLVPVNQFEHFYRGGRRIVALRGGDTGVGSHRPEDWIGSMTTLSSSRERGLSRLADGTVLRDAVLSEPDAWLGPAHVAAYGASTELLVKLLDPGQRLPVHLHPDRAFAGRHLGVRHGKTEAWIVLEAAAGARVRLGFADGMRLADVRAMVAGGDSAGLVAALRPVAVRPGDAVLVPAGVPHSLGSDVFLLELQEPADLSILLEAEGVDVDVQLDGHLGLGFDVALRALRLDALGDAELDGLRGPREPREASGPVALLPAAAEPYFRAHRVRGGGRACTVAPGFGVGLVAAGAGRLVTDSGAGLALRRGDAVVVPFAAGAWRLDGEVEVVLCRPPLPGDGPASP